MLEVEADATFAAIETKEKVRHAAGEGRSPAAAHVAFAGFEFVDLGAVVGEEQGAVGAGEGMGEVENADAMKGFFGHGLFIVEEVRRERGIAGEEESLARRGGQERKTRDAWHVDYNDV
jgi:hypothetical protein